MSVVCCVLLCDSCDEGGECKFDMVGEISVEGLCGGVVKCGYIIFFFLIGVLFEVVSKL